MLKDFIKKEEARYGHPLNSFHSIPVETYRDLMKNYDVYEFTEHWYDGLPEECYTCDHNKNCDKCVFIKEWEDSFEQLTFNNWIDVWGPGIWDQSQEDVNNLVKEIFEDELLIDKEFTNRLFWYQPEDKNYFQLFYLDRDRKKYDYWFVFKKRETSPK